MLLSHRAGRVKHPTGRLLSFLLVVLGAFLLSPTLARGGDVALRGDYLVMAEVHGPGATGRLAVVTADQTRPWRHKTLAFLEKRGATLVETSAVPLWDDAAALDVCRLDPKSPEQTVLLARPGGVYRAGETTPLAKGETLFAHAADGALPRLRLCYDLFPGAPPALVVPTLAGVSVYRAATASAPYKLVAALPTDADVRFMWQTLRTGDPTTGQHVGIRLDYPDVAAVDFDGDGRVDLCLALGEGLSCFLQDAAGKGFSPLRARRFTFDLLTESERADTSIRVESRVLPLAGAGKLPSLILKKTDWNVSAMGTTLYVFDQRAGGGFAGKPAQTIARKGFFAYQDYRDLDGDGDLDLIAPTTTMDWSDLAHLFFRKSADLDFLWYRGDGHRFAAEPHSLHAMAYPVEFKNVGAVLGALPLWDVHVAPDTPGERQVAFFPGRESVEVYGIDRQPRLRLLWQTKAPVGSDALATDLDGDGRSELVFASPHEAERGRRLLFLAP